MILRQRLPGGINRDVDLGPSGYHPRGHTFEQLASIPRPSDRVALKVKASNLEYKRAHRKPRVRGPVCGSYMPMAKTTCARLAGHNTTSAKYPDHRTREALDRLAESKKRPIE